MKKYLIPLVALSAALTLASCSGESDQKDPSENQDSGTIEPIEGSTADTGSKDETQDDTTAGADADKGREVPAACASLTLDVNQTYSGTELGECVSSALASYESGRMDMTGDQLDGTVDFTYNPNYNFQVTGTGNGTDVKLVYTDSVMWVDSGNGWVKGDLTSSNQEEMLAGVAGEMYRIYADPAMTADLVAASDKWTSDPEKALRTLPNGENVDTYRIVNAEPFTWNDFEVQEFILWYGQDWLPAGTQATSSIAGLPAATYSQDFYDLGADITITAPK